MLTEWSVGIVTQLWDYAAQYKDGIGVVIDFGALVISALTVIIAVCSGLHSLVTYVKDRRNKQLTEFITLFSDDNEIKRLSGMNGLKRYTKALFNELFFICSIEERSMIRELIYNSLIDHAGRKKQKCIDINRFMIRYLLAYDFDDGLLKVVKQNPQIMAPLKHGQIISRIRLELNKMSENSVLENSQAIDNHMLLSSRLLAAALRKSFNRKLSGCMIYHSDLYKSRWCKDLFSNCVLMDNIARHLVSWRTAYEYAYISKNDFFDGRFYGSYFQLCNLVECVFRKSKLSRTFFERGRMKGVTFNESSISDCSFHMIDSIYECEWNGCRVRNTNFYTLRIAQNSFMGTNFVRCRFSNVKLWRCMLLGEFWNCHFVDVDLGGSIIKTSSFVNCTFKNVKFVGANIRKSTFTKCTFENCDPSEAHTEDITKINC